MTLRGLIYGGDVMGKFRIAFYKAQYGDIFDAIVSKTTHSPYSHCELIFSDGVCASSSPRDDGVRFANISFGNHWDIFDLHPDLSENDARWWFAYNDGQAYDFIGAIGSAFKLPFHSKKKKFCSLACAAALELDEINLTPGGLYKKLKRLGYI